MSVRGLSQLLPRRKGVFDEPRIKVANAPTGMTERVAPEECVEVIVDPLPVEREVVADKDRPSGTDLFEPLSESLHDIGGIVKRFVLLARMFTDCQRLQNEMLGDRFGLAVERLRQHRLNKDRAKADHRV